jgi:hypothetical protein
MAEKPPDFTRRRCIDFFGSDWPSAQATCGRGSDSGHQQVDRGIDFLAPVRQVGNTLPQGLDRHAGQLRRDHQVRRSFDLESGRQRFQFCKLHGSGGIQRHHDPGGEVGDQVALDVQQQGDGLSRGRVAVPVDRRPSLNTPSASTLAL